MAKASPRLMLVLDGVRQQIDDEARLEYDASDKKELDENSK